MFREGFASGVGKMKWIEFEADRGVLRSGFGADRSDVGSGNALPLGLRHQPCGSHHSISRLVYR